jgi:hypothetical protein
VAGLVVARIPGRDQLAAELSAELVDRGVVGLLGGCLLYNLTLPTKRIV